MLNTETFSVLAARMKAAGAPAGAVSPVRVSARGHSFARLGLALPFNCFGFVYKETVMPIPTGEKWHLMPFSYRKACNGFAVLLLLPFIVVMVSRFATGMHTDAEFNIWFWGGFSVLFAGWHIATLVMWRSLSPELRAALPYDSSEATKGTIHSWADLRDWIRRRRTSVAQRP